jgi:hypothetical protein
MLPVDLRHERAKLVVHGQMVEQPPPRDATKQSLVLQGVHRLAPLAFG